MGCSVSKLNCAPAEWIAPNPDIAGVGVIWSFVLNMAFTIALSIAAFLKPEYPHDVTHPVDIAIYRRLGKPVVREADHDDDFGSAAKPGSIPVILRDIILGLCTQQQLLGIALLGARNATCDITVYHSEIVRTLAIFSFGTQMTAIQAIRFFLVKNRHIRNICVFLLLIMAGMALHVTILHGHRDVYENAPTLANCLFTDSAKSIGGKPMDWMIVNIVLLSVALIMAIDSVFPRQSILVWRTPKDAKRLVGELFFPLHNFFLSWAKGMPKWISILVLLPVALAINLVLAALCAALLLPWLAVWIYIWLFDGVLPSVAFDIFWFSFSLWDLLDIKAWGTQHMTPEALEKERTWGFGQVLPMILCVLPILAAVQEILKSAIKARPQQLSSVSVHSLVPQPLSAQTWDTIAPAIDVPAVARKRELRS